MKILKVISLLLDYPTQVIFDAKDELAQAIAATRVISPEQRLAVQALVDELTAGDLMDAQEAYVKLFNRGRHFSLLLFEHVHGESRDRGQAMVDLMAQYENDALPSILKSCRIISRCTWSTYPTVTSLPLARA